MNLPIKIYLLDDDPVFLRHFTQALESFLKQQSHPFQLIPFTNGSNLLQQAAGEDQISLLISDIDLGPQETSGLWVAKELRRQFPSCSIIYLTAFLEYATEIYDSRPLYFILKDEYRQRIPAAMTLFFQDYAKKQKTLTINSGRTQAVLHIQDLIYCEHIGRKTNLICTDRQLTVPDTIAGLMEKLPAKEFAICHKGYIVGLRHVRAYRRDTVLLQTGQELPISRARYAHFRTVFAAYLSES